MTFGAETTELTTIQRLLDKEHSMEHRYLPSSFTDDVQPLVITLEKALTEAGYETHEERRVIRLEILRRITRQDIESTNQLSRYQCRVIYKFLIDKDSDDYRATEHGKRLLDSITRDFEAYGVLEEKQTKHGE